jgi:hypothetical protein
VRRSACSRRGRTKDRDIKALPIEDHGDTDAIFVDDSSSVSATEQLQRLEPEERGNVSNKAKRSTRPGVRPMITTNLLAANIEYQTCE